MKRSIIIFIIILALPLYASEVPSGLVSQPFYYPSNRQNAMGQAGIAIPHSEEAFYGNPAVLGLHLNYFSIPEMTFQAVPASKLYNSPWIDAINGDQKAIDNIAQLLSGQERTIFINEAMRTTFGGFAFGLDLSEIAYTYKVSDVVKVIPAIDFVLSLGYGHRWFISPQYALSFGAMLHGGIRATSDPVSMADAFAYFNGKESFDVSLSDITLSSDIGFLLSVPLGFSVGSVFRNFGGKIVLPGNLSDDKSAFSEDLTFDVGVGWERDFTSWFSLSLAYDFVNLPQAFSEDDPSFLKHSNFGAEADIGSALALYGGFRGGNPSCGFRLRAFLFVVDFSYYLQDWVYNDGEDAKDVFSFTCSVVFN